MRPPLSGVVTHPTDLQPAINQLGPIAKKYLDELSEGGEVKPWMIAKAADHGREHGES